MRLFNYIPLLALTLLATTSTAFSQAGVTQVPDAPQILDVGAGSPVFGAPPAQPIAPGQCEAPSGRRCWYVDANAAPGGNGSKDAPFNSFERVAGYVSGPNYYPGLIKGGDYLYLKGTFRASQHDDTSHSMVLILGRGAQGGSVSQPTVIKTLPGAPRAVFDGEMQLPNLVEVSAQDGAPNNGVRIENIEVMRAGIRGIHISENVAFAELSGVVVHDGVGNGDNGVGGGVVFRMVSAVVHNFLIHDSVIYGNNKNPFGSENNIGGISILSEPAALPGSKTTIYNNEIYNETKAIRHKHWGNTLTVAYSNRIHDCQSAFYIRATDSDLHNNIIYGCGAALQTVAENQGGDTYARFYNNTVYNTPTLINTGIDTTNFRRRIDLYNNIYASTDSVDGVVVLGEYSTNYFNKSDLVSRNNIFYYPASGSSFLIHQNRKLGLTLGLEYIGDNSSQSLDPRFENPAGGDFRLQSGSPAAGRGAL